jgi:hypothetical protein
MKLFECQNCGQPLYFENTRCEGCGLSLGYLPERECLSALRPHHSIWVALAEPRGEYRYCSNAEHGTCNWLISAAAPEESCVACRHNRTIPDLGQPDTLGLWRRIEIAKHRLFYSLLRLRLSTKTRTEDPDGLAFDFLADRPATSPGTVPVMTGYANGVITINVAEADDAERERRRRQMGEPYRTLLGHFRHEIAHYYWQRLVFGDAKLDEFRHVFGDERAEYGQALQRYYKLGGEAHWPERFISAYATAHPWEDFAETWAHYFHMVDTLETAAGFGLVVASEVPRGVAARVHFDPYKADMDQLIKLWIPLTFAANSLNRSMGLPDLYPFVLNPPVITKLVFVHACIHAKGGRQTTTNDSLRAMIAGLRQRTAVGMQP